MRRSRQLTTLKKSLGTIVVSSIVWSVGCTRPPEPAIATTEGAVSTPTASEAQVLTAAEMVEDLTYQQWKAFPRGTTVVRRTITRNAAATKPTISYTTIRLLERTDDHIVLEQQTRTERSSGETIQNEPMTFRYTRLIPLPPNMRREEWGKPQGIREQGTETIEVLGQSYRCTYMKYASFTEAGEMLSTIWVSPEMPGGLVKSHSYVANANETTTIEIVQISIPK